MSTPEGSPKSVDLSSLKPIPEKRERGWSVKNPAGPKQQPANSSHELAEYYRREQERHSGVLENPIRVPRPLPRKPSEQRGEAGASKPNPAEQQTPQRRRTRRELARLAQDPELRSLADELWGKTLTKGRLTNVISESLYRYPDLPPDEALREYRDDFQGFSFA
jgi:hypothetical protein